MYNPVLVSGVQQSGSVIHTYINTHILFHLLFPYRLLQNITYSSRNGVVLTPFVKGNKFPLESCV